jgi:hypothetical protein
MQQSSDRMLRRRRCNLSRRAALAGLAMAAAYGPGAAESVAGGLGTEDGAGPVFSPSGPDAGLYGAGEGFPVTDPALAQPPGDPQPKYRVGAYSRFDQIFRTRLIKRAAVPWMFKRSQADILYRFRDRRSSVTEYLSRNPVTGLLIAKDDRIVVEHYQYGRTGRDRLYSGSMAKTIAAMLIGIAISDGAIRSVDDTAATYVPGFRGSEYGNTPIRDLLHMSSGVDFGEDKYDGRDLDRLWIDMVRGSGSGTIGNIVQFNRRVAQPGTRFSYASTDSVSSSIRRRSW